MPINKSKFKLISKFTNKFLLFRRFIRFSGRKSLYLRPQYKSRAYNRMDNKEGKKPKLNRIKVVLAEQDKSNLWLCEQIGRDPATVSKWCTNSAQPPLEALIDIAQALNVGVEELVRMPEPKQK